VAVSVRTPAAVVGVGLIEAIPEAAILANADPNDSERLSPVHERTSAAGATFGTRNGWERPLYFGPTLDYRWGKPDWLEHSCAEQVACRTAVAVFDQTSFSKYAVSGPDALRSLEWVCANDVDVPVGQAVYTPWLNARGAYESDVTVTRTAVDEFLIVSSAATTVRDLAWLDEHLDAGADVHVDDLTDEFAVLGVMGPRSRELLSRMTDTGLDDDAFAFATSRPLDLAGARVRATRMTYVGELGWELLVPNGAAVAVFDALHDHGDELGLADGGYSAIESLRLEKGFRAFGRDLTPDYTPVEAGLVFATALSGSKDFLGRAALEERRERLKESGPRRRLVSFVVGDPDAMLWGGELVLRDGEPVGQVTSAAYGATVGASVGLAYLRRDEAITSAWLAEGGFEVDLAGERLPVTATLKAPLA
jgi:4-methylaminobutanoate oxidase (formaldehyde-forming)